MERKDWVYKRKGARGSLPTAHRESTDSHPLPGFQLTSAQGPVYQHHVISQGRKLQARMSGGRLPGAQLCSLVPTPASSWPAPRVSPLPRQTTERRWIPVPHSAEHCEQQRRGGSVRGDASDEEGKR